jgi:hypothetical protein
MYVKKVLAATAAAGVVALTGAGAAQAATSSVVVQPGTAMAGAQVSVYGTACTASTGTATSNAFAAPIPLSMLSNSTGGVGNIAAGAKPGTYSVMVTCGSQSFTGSVMVAPNGGAKTGDGASLVGGGTSTTGLALLGGAGALGLAVLARRRAGANR